MLRPVVSSRFKRDVKRQRKRGADVAKLKGVIDLLLSGSALPPSFLDHPLSGEWNEYRDLHIEPDWVLLYRIDGDTLKLARTGTHADIFE